jgi:hypothetical protein
MSKEVPCVLWSDRIERLAYGFHQRFFRPGANPVQETLDL